MLPFLKPKRMATIIMARRKPDGNVETVKEEGEDLPGLMSAADDLIKAVHAKDSKAVAEALKAAFQMIDSDEDLEDESEEDDEA